MPLRSKERQAQDAARAPLRLRGYEDLTFAQRRAWAQSCRKHLRILQAGMRRREKEWQTLYRATKKLKEKEAALER